MCFLNQYKTFNIIPTNNGGQLYKSLIEELTEWVTTPTFSMSSMRHFPMSLYCHDMTMKLVIFMLTFH